MHKKNFKLAKSRVNKYVIDHGLIYVYYEIYCPQFHRITADCHVLCTRKLVQVNRDGDSAADSCLMAL